MTCYVFQTDTCTAYLNRDNAPVIASYADVHLDGWTTTVRADKGLDSKQTKVLSMTRPIGPSLIRYQAL